MTSNLVAASRPTPEQIAIQLKQKLAATQLDRRGSGSSDSQGSDCFKMDCDSDDDMASASQQRRDSAVRQAPSMQPSLSSRLGFAVGTSMSNSSLASSASSSQEGENENEPELSRSLGSTRSFDLRTPIKPPHAIHDDDGKMSQDPRSAFALSGANGEPNWSSALHQSPEAMLRHLNYPPQLGSRSSPNQSPRQLPGLSLGPDSRSDPQPSRPSGPRAQAPGTSGRLKILLPPNNLTASTGVSEPFTPGGSLFHGARDGAANSSVPVSPFEPPTPLTQPGVSPFIGGSSSGTPQHGPTRRAQQKKQSGGPSAVRSPSRAASPLVRPTVSRHSSMGLMSPLSSDFAAVSVRRDTDETSSTATDERRGSLPSQQADGKSAAPFGVAANLTSSPQSMSSALLTPYSPLGATRSLPDEGRRSSLGSLGSKAKLAALTASKSRATSPYPPVPRQDAAAVPQPISSSTLPPIGASSRTAEPNPRRPSSSDGDVKTAKPSPSLLVAPPMQKCKSAPMLEPASAALARPPASPVPSAAPPQTVSARHLADRALLQAFTDQYVLEDELGSGGFGFVVGATRVADGRPVAVKFIWKDRVPNHGWVRDPRFGVIPMEAFVLRIVDHPGIVQFIDLMDDDAFFYLIMELHGTPWKAPEQKPAAAAPPTSTGAEAQPSKSSALLASPAGGASVPLSSPTVAVFAPESEVPTVIDADTADEDMTTGVPSTGGSSRGSSAGSLSDASSLALSATSSPPSSIMETQRPALAKPAPMERRSSCDLFECIEQHSRLPEDKARWVFAQIVEAVHYLDRKGITHRDIKDENCVIDADFNVKLIDFGSAVLTDVRQPAPYFDRFFGTMTFASSEILQGKKYRAPHAEVWSLGVLLSILLSGECPFSDPQAAIRGKISRPKGKWSHEALNLLMGCLEVDPDRRATIVQVREHPWVRAAWDVPGRARPA